MRRSQSAGVIGIQRIYSKGTIRWFADGPYLPATIGDKSTGQLNKLFIATYCHTLLNKAERKSFRAGDLQKAVNELGSHTVTEPAAPRYQTYVLSKYDLLKRTHMLSGYYRRRYHLGDRAPVASDYDFARNE